MIGFSVEASLWKVSLFGIYGYRKLHEEPGFADSCYYNSVRPLEDYLVLSWMVYIPNFECHLVSSWISYIRNHSLFRLSTA